MGGQQIMSLFADVTFDVQLESAVQFSDWITTIETVLQQDLGIWSYYKDQLNNFDPYTMLTATGKYETLQQYDLTIHFLLTKSTTPAIRAQASRHAPAAGKPQLKYLKDYFSNLPETSLVEPMRDFLTYMDPDRDFTPMQRYNKLRTFQYLNLSEREKARFLLFATNNPIALQAELHIRSQTDYQFTDLECVVNELNAAYVPPVKTIKVEDNVSYVNSTSDVPQRSNSPNHNVSDQRSNTTQDINVPVVPVVPQRSHSPSYNVSEAPQRNSTPQDNNVQNVPQRSNSPNNNNVQNVPQTSNTSQDNNVPDVPQRNNSPQDNNVPVTPQRSNSPNHNVSEVPQRINSPINSNVLDAPQSSSTSNDNNVPDIPQTSNSLKENNSSDLPQKSILKNNNSSNIQSEETSVSKKNTSEIPPERPRFPRNGSSLERSLTVKYPSHPPPERANVKRRKVSPKCNYCDKYSHLTQQCYKKPKSWLQIQEEYDHYSAEEGHSSEEKKVSSKKSKKCTRCKKPGNLAEVCRAKNPVPNSIQSPQETQKGKLSVRIPSSKEFTYAPKNQNVPKCTICKKRGHLYEECWFKRPKKIPAGSRPRGLTQDAIHVNSPTSKEVSFLDRENQPQEEDILSNLLGNWSFDTTGTVNELFVRDESSNNPVEFRTTAGRERSGDLSTRLG